MNRITYLRLVLWACAWLLLASSYAAERPNIIFIMSDDHTSQALGIYGSRLTPLDPTPHLDALARQGMVLDQCFVTNSICTPSRASIMTGQYSQTNGVLDLDGRLPADRQYLAIEMGKLGYQTAIIGKWHLKEEPASFDHYCVLPGQGDYFDPTFRIRGPDLWPNETLRINGHSTDVITDLAIRWLSERIDERPFFLMLQYKAPHDMFEFAPRYASYLEDVFIPEPASLYYNAGHGSEATRGGHDSLLHTIGSSVSHRNVIRNMGMHMDIDGSLPDPLYTHLAYQEYLKRYLRCVKGIDDNIGRLLTSLNQQGLDSAVIAYTADQGFMLGEHDYIDKRWMYEESMRMPFIISWPGVISADHRTDAIINNTDFAPTLLDIAGGTPPPYMQGVSFKQILLSHTEPPDWRQSTYYRYWMHMAHRHANPAHFGIRTQKYKLIFYYGRYWVDTDSDVAWNRKSWGNRFDLHTPPAWEFYDLTKDPMEMNNRYEDKTYHATIDTLKSQLRELRRNIDETDKNYPHIQKIIDAYWN